MITTVLLVFFSEVLSAVGQICFKMGTNHASSAHRLQNVSSQLAFLRDVVRRPFIWCGLAALGAGLVVWVVALAGNGLSIVFSLGSMQYIFIMVLAHVLLGEKIDRHKVIGTLLVVLGIVLIAIG